MTIPGRLPLTASSYTTKPFMVVSPSLYVTGSCLIAALALATIARAHSAPAIIARMLTSCGVGASILTFPGFGRQGVTPPIGAAVTPL